jgi:hypothetical protein
MKTLPFLLITLCILQSCIQHNQPPKFPDLPLLPDHKNYENLDKFGKVISELHDSLGKKYHIKDYAFDVECIYQQEYLTKAEAAFGMRK